MPITHMQVRLALIISLFVVASVPANAHISKKPNAQKAIAANLPNAKHKTLEGQNHMVAPTAIAPVIKEFLAA